MTQENQIQKAKKELPVINELGFTIGQVATILTDSGFFGKSLTPNQAITKIMIGAELGMNTMQSIMNIDCWDGNIGIRSNWRATAIKKHPKYDYRIVNLDSTSCTIMFLEFEKSTGDFTKELGETTFTIEDAKKANLLGKQNWQKTPKNMLFARAMSDGQKFYCPEVIGEGLPTYDLDEIEEIKKSKPETNQGASLSEQLKSAAKSNPDVKTMKQDITGDFIEGEIIQETAPESPVATPIQPTPQPKAPAPVATAPDAKTGEVKQSPVDELAGLMLLAFDSKVDADKWAGNTYGKTYNQLAASINYKGVIKAINEIIATRQVDAIQPPVDAPIMAEINGDPFED